ncbi:ABC transporter ATP-binding protein [Halovivax gelatinilyticus]|uniref:ABC transporter ATP-binding protein n=1 Tax=Halovivax gelatinilyticus TaxID=2961597 RepID=UPI0020CA2A05|nr:ABC transporter ATP-binding protein [Halovivax gelatinilyticus]
MDPVVAADGVEKRYGETVALDDVSLSIDAGEVYCLIGPNGAGKTTLVRTLTGTIAPDDGVVQLLGDDPTRVDASEIGVLPQSFSPPARLSSLELLTYYASRYPSARDPESVLDAVGLTDSADTWYETLSGGQQRRLCVGSTLLNDPAVLVLDEPTTGIDPVGRRTIWALIESLADDGTAVLVTTHDMAEAEYLADRVGLLSNGSLVESGTPEALIDTYAGASRLRIELATTASTAEAQPTSEKSTQIDQEATDGSDPNPVRERIDSVISNRVTLDGAEVTVHDVAARDIGTIVDELDAIGIEYTGLSWEEPGLEDVYFELTQSSEPSRSTTNAGGTSADRATSSTLDSSATDTIRQTATNPTDELQGEPDDRTKRRRETGERP